MLLARIACLALALAAIPRVARAQCEANGSSCVECHEARGQHPVLSDGTPWHRDHAFADLCAGCHAGDPSDADESRAHATLADPRASCVSCHADARAYSTTPAPGSTPPSPPPPRAGASSANLALAALGLALAVVLGVQLRRGRTRTLPALLRAPTWSPYAAGAGLGVVVAITLAVVGRPLSASAAFDKLAAYVAPSTPYYVHVMTPGITWPVWLMVGVLLGSFASSRLAHTARLRWLPDAQWVPRFGPSRWLRLGFAFGGAMLVQLGAGIAGGCTSGLAISGGALLAPAAFLFMAGMFAGGIPTAWLLWRTR